MSGVVLRRTNETSGIIHWPSCARCSKVVTAYGVTDETDRYIEIWAEHHGERDGVRIEKGPGWTQARFSRVMRVTAFFASSQDGASRILKPVPLGRSAGRRIWTPS